MPRTSLGVDRFWWLGAVKQMTRNQIVGLSFGGLCSAGDCFLSDLLSLYVLLQTLLQVVLSSYSKKILSMAHLLHIISPIFYFTYQSSHLIQVSL